MRKLDNIINALESGATADAPAAAAPTASAGGASAGASVSSGAEASERLATVKQTREMLLLNPNSTGARGRRQRAARGSSGRITQSA